MSPEVSVPSHLYLANHSLPFPTSLQIEPNSSLHVDEHAIFPSCGFRQMFAISNIVMYDHGYTVIYFLRLVGKLRILQDRRFLKKQKKGDNYIESLDMPKVMHKDDFDPSWL